MGCSLDAEGEGGVQNVEKKQAIRKLVVGVCVMEKKVSLPFLFFDSVFVFFFFFFFFGSRIDDDDDRRTHIPFFLSFVDVFCHPCVEELCFLCLFSSLLLLSFFLFCFRFPSFNGAKKISMVL
jgi:hypothetical protein